MKSRFQLLRSGLAGAFVAWGLAAAAAPAPAFELPRFEGGSPVKLADYAGQVVVLDFFAHWCGPCAKSAPVIEEQIQKYYAGRRGNAHGLPVRVISVNVEPGEPGKTAAFIHRHGPSLVVNDDDGATLKKFGGSALPFLVILDGSKATAANPAFEVAYARAGFPGAQALRDRVDAIGEARR